MPAKQFPTPEPLEPDDNAVVEQEEALMALDRVSQVLDTVPDDFADTLNDIEVQIKSARPMETVLSFFDPQKIGLAVKASAWSIYHEYPILVAMAKGDDGETGMEKLAAMDRMRKILKDSLIAAGGFQAVHQRTESFNDAGDRVITDKTAVALIQNVASHAHVVLGPSKEIAHDDPNDQSRDEPVERSNSRGADRTEPESGSPRSPRSSSGVRTILGRDGKRRRVPGRRRYSKKKSKKKIDRAKEARLQGEDDLGADDVGGSLPSSYTGTESGDGGAADTGSETAIDQALGHRPPTIGQNEGICSSQD